MATHVTGGPHRPGHADAANCRGLITVTMTFRRPRTRRRHPSYARYVYRIEHSATIVAACGDIDASNACDLLQEARCRTVIRRAPLILDLTAVTFLGSDGLPLAVQLVGRVGAEDTLFSLAGQIEAAAPWAQRRPTVS